MQLIGTAQWQYKVLAVGLSLVMVAAHGQVAFSQNNAARNAAGYMILQNNRTQQELRETKQELREIKEGLGLGSTDSSRSDEEPSLSKPVAAVLLVLMSVVTVIGSLASFVWIANEIGKIDQYLNEGNSERLQRAIRARTCVLTLIVTPIVLIAAYATLWCLYRKEVVPKGQEWTSYTTIFGIRSEIIGWSMFLFYAWLYARALYTTRESVIKKMIKAHRTKASIGLGATAQQPGTPNPHQSFVRLPTGEIKGPGEKANIRVLAKQGKYPPGTQWSNTANGPWETLVDEVVVKPVLRIWIRTPDGRSGGPYTKDQIRKAIATGKLPANAQAASTPSGPWRSIGSFSG
jgi:hypothetical protein